VADRLAELLVKDGALSTMDAERAAARQQEAGGTLDTALLELELLDEEKLAGFLARASGLPPAPDGAWGDPDARARRVFPAKVAERHGIAPFALEGRDLSVVSAYPPDLGLLDEISFMLSLHLRPHVAPEFRVRDLVHRLYGTTVPQRLKALRERRPGDGRQVVAVDDFPDADVEEPADEMSAPTPAPSPAPSAALPPAPEAEAKPAPPAAPAKPEPVPAAAPSRRGTNGSLQPALSALAQALGSVPPPRPAPPREVEPEPPAREAGSPPAGPRWTLGEARAALASANDRDEVILAALRYTRDFFEYAAVFAVTRDALYGHEAMGRDEAARDECRRVAVELSDPGFFRTPIETRGPYLGPPALDPVTASMLAGLRRGTPRTVLLHPVFVRERPVCVLYADNGEAPVSARRLGDLFLLLSSLGSSFERVIRERKLHPAPSPEEEDWQVKEPARSPESDPLPISVDVDMGEYEVASAADALSSPRALDFAWAVERLAQSARGSAERSSLIAQLAQRAAEAAPALVERLPGPIEVREGLSELTPVEEQGPVLAALAALGSAATRPLLASLADPDPDRRRYAVLLLGGQGDPDALPGIANRVFDEDIRVATAARQSLLAAKHRPEMKPLAESLRRELTSGKPSRAIHAARALAGLGDAESVSLLIQLLERGGELGAVAAEALCRITLQRLGSDPGRWLAWWQEHRSSPRSRWLLEALTSPDRDMRQVASDELRESGAPPVPYFADAPAPERERAARAWADWWYRRGPAA